MTKLNNPNDKYVLLAKKLEEEGDYLTAEKMFLKAVTKNSELLDTTDSDEIKIAYINDDTNYRAKLGAFYLRNQLYDRAEPFLLGAAEVKETIVNNIDIPIVKRELALIYSDLADLYQYEERFENSIKYNSLSSSILDKLIDMYNQVDDKDKLSSRFINLAMINNELSNISLSEKYYLEAISLQEEIVNERIDDKYKSKLAITYIGLANLYISNNNPKTAERYLYKAIDVLSKIYKIYDNYVSGRALAICYSILANLSNDINLVDKYLNYAVEVRSILLERFEFKDDAEDIIDIYERLSEICKNNGKPIKALSYRNKANKFRKMIS